MSDSSHQQEQTPPKVFSSPTNVPKTGKNGINRLSRPNTAYGPTKALLPNKMSLDRVQQKPVENEGVPVFTSSDQVIPEK